MKLSNIIHIGLLIAFLAVAGHAQNQSKLASNYFFNGEYAKAAVLYKSMYQRNKRSTYYFDKYVECLFQLEQYDLAEKEVKKALRNNKNKPAFYVTLGRLKELQLKDDEAEKLFQQAIDKLTANRSDVIVLANSFIGLAKYEWAEKTYNKGSKLIKDQTVYAYYLADLHRRSGNTPKMISAYLRYINKDPNRLTYVKKRFSSYLKKSDYDELQMQLYDRIQENPDDISFAQLLEWLFVQKGDYKAALRQVTAIDRRNNETGNNVFALAKIAQNAEAFSVAIDAYEYIIREKGINNPYYIPAKKEQLRCKMYLLERDKIFDDSTLLLLEHEFIAFLSEFGRNSRTAEFMMNFADFEVYYLHDYTKANEILQQVVSFAGLEKHLLGEAKIRLADTYLILRDRWEATLLYAQVDKAFPEDPLGERARYKNAKLAYYSGDFEWAQAQFDILKSATSRWISNDAIDLSVFIMDNMGLDTTPVPMQKFARAELLIFQKEYDAAVLTLDSINELFPGHGLADDILFVKGKIYEEQRDFDQAIAYYETLIANFPDEIRTDNALYALAQIYENDVNNVEKATELYEKLFITYASSTFAIEARKRYRILRGDEL